MIVSRQNQKVKNIRRLRRCKGDSAVLEGPHLVGEALASGVVLEFALATADFLTTPVGTALKQQLGSLLSPVEPALLEELCDSDSPRGIVAVVTLPRRGVESTPVARDGLYLYVDGVQDPGNLGALARVAEAFGVASMCLSPESSHPNHPRALRASAGSLVRLPVSVGVEAPALADHLQAISPSWLALAPRGGADPAKRSFTRPWILAVGAEGPGLSAAVVQLADHLLTIPLAPPVESLNATVAAALVLYELVGKVVAMPASQL